MRTTFNTIVLGLGGIGSGAAYWLSRRLGADVLGIEQFEFNHARGESHDHTRIIRHSYHTPQYVELTKHAYAAWRALEADCGQRLIVTTGGLDLAPREGAAIRLMNYSKSLSAAGISHEVLDGTEIAKRWPQFNVDERHHGVFQADGGIATPELSNRAHLRMAREHGATLIDNAPVTQIEDRNGEITVRAGDQAFICKKLVIAAGPWTNNALTHLGCSLPLEVSREQVVYFDSPHINDFLVGRFPVWIWMDEPCFYGFPVYGHHGVKLAQDCGGYITTGDTRTFELDPANFQRVRDFAARYMPRALGPSHLIKTCLYTLTPDRDFVLDTLPEHPNVSVAIGAGHAYKFASVLGKILSELAIDGATPCDIDALNFDRHILTLADPPKSYSQ